MKKMKTLLLTLSVFILVHTPYTYTSRQRPRQKETPPMALLYEEMIKDYIDELPPGPAKTRMISHLHDIEDQNADLHESYDRSRD